jgi:serine/threonine protein kinase
MENWRTCLLGHRWEVGEGPRCPVCGEGPEGVPPEALDDTVEASPEELLSPANGEALPDRPETFPRIPGYQILALLGEGGMGVVYKACQTALKRTVAIKTLRELRDGVGGRERFLREAAAAARLQHPGIVRVFEVGTVPSDGSPFFSLEFCPGGSLEDKLAGNPLEPREAARIVKTIAQAVQAAHEQGIVHRDLKPANILLSPIHIGSERDGPEGLTASGCWYSGPDDPSAEPSPLAGWVAKVADFGLAREVDTEPGQTGTGTILGSPCYMAPEQAWGESKRVGLRADVWALGAILYECLTGRPPFKGPSALATLQQIAGHEPVPPHRLQPSVPPDLDTICLKCLEKDPARRYASAQELAQDLARFLEGQPIRARPPRWWERLYRWARRRPGMAE